MGLFSKLLSSDKKKDNPSEAPPSSPPKAKRRPTPSEMTAMSISKNSSKISSMVKLCEQNRSLYETKYAAESAKLKQTYAQLTALKNRGDVFNAKLKLKDCAHLKSNCNDYQNYISQWAGRATTWNKASELLFNISQQKLMAPATKEVMKELNYDDIDKIQEMEDEFNQKIQELNQTMNTNNPNDFLQNLSTVMVDSGEIEFSEADLAMMEQLDSQFSAPNLLKNPPPTPQPSSLDIDISLDPVPTPDISESSKSDLDGLSAMLN